jgi:hypothetical protein
MTPKFRNHVRMVDGASLWYQVGIPDYVAQNIYIFHSLFGNAKSIIFLKMGRQLHLDHMIPLSSTKDAKSAPCSVNEHFVKTILRILNPIRNIRSRVPGEKYLHGK